MATISLGSAIGRSEIIAAVFESDVVTDPTDSTCQLINIKDNFARCPRHYQVAIIPYDGDQLAFDFGVILPYALAYTQQSNLVFSPTTPREFTFDLYAEPHPTTGDLANIYYAQTPGTDCEILRNAVPADCLPT